jgi:hypothetical protein
MASAVIADADVRIVSALSCPSVSGKSKLTYHLGVHGISPVIRIHGNTGPGFFNDEWITVSKVIDSLPKGEPFTSYTLRSVFKGRSMNSRAFLMAVLSSEGVVRRSTERPRCWERADIDGFLARVQGEAPGTSQPKAPVHKAAAHKFTASTEPTAKARLRSVPKSKK